MRGTYSTLPQASADVEEIAHHIAEDSLDAADRFLDATESTFQRLAEHPHIGVACGFSGEFADLRRYSVRGSPNYLVFYRIREQSVEIIRVLHGARDIEAMFEPEP